MVKAMLVVAALAAVLPAVPACAFKPGKETQTVILKESGPAYGFTFLINDVHVKVDPPLRYEWTDTKENRIERTREGSSSRSDHYLEVKVNDEVVEVSGGELLIGGRSFGIVKAGDQVLLDGKGVHVNGEHRGEL